MADKSSRDGASGLGWLVIGLLIGVAGTLATQKFAVFKSVAAPDASAAVQPPAPAAPVAGPPKLLVHQGGLAPSSAAPATPNTTGQTAAEVADDAAATGMTARAKPQQPPTN
jgi:hypothetical protein